MFEGRRRKTRHRYYYSRVYDENTHRQAGRLVDITTDGIRIVSENPIKTNTTFQFRMVLPGEIEGKRTICFDVLSKWCNNTSDSDLFDAGFTLLNITPDKAQIIEHLIEESKSDA